ncbi:MAG: hypothetical protein NZL95_01820 [Chitinophagales bacterium]|nr:hypothetical protein [Chitinophagales bacterium]MDW8427272.1 hypothetical protein [Chitinophagales bacterium]
MDWVQWTLLFFLPIEARALELDPLGNLYLTKPTQELVKLDSLGNVLFTYPQNRWGVLHRVEATNPMKILLSYHDYAQIVVLDNTLSELGVLSLQRLGINSCSATAFSPRDNAVWIYDREQWNLKKIDLNGNIVLDAPDMLQQLGIVLEPVFMVEHHNRLYISDTTNGIFVFDAYGLFLEQLPLSMVTNFQVSGTTLVGMQKGAVVLYDLIHGKSKNISPPVAQPCQGVRILHDRWFMLFPSGLYVYRLLHR